MATLLRGPSPPRRPIPFRYGPRTGALRPPSAAVTIALTPMSLAQIRYFIAVAEEQNVGRAARRLHVAQPPVSRQIRSLEDEIGAALFTRTPRGMELLPAGQTFLGHARKILEAVDAAVEGTRGVSANANTSAAAGMDPNANAG